MAEIANIRFFRGEDVTLTITLTPETDISAWAGIEFAFARELGAEPLFTKTLADGVTKADAANGVISVSIDSADTANLEAADGGPETRYVYAVRRTDVRTVVAIGNVTLMPEVAA